MGKGDKKSRRGKIHIGSYGKRRPHPKGTSFPAQVITTAKEKAVKEAEPETRKPAKTAEPEATAAPKKTPRKTTKKKGEETPTE